MRAAFELNGRHVLLVTLSFFAMVIAVNAAFIVFALNSYPGEQERKSYRQGLNYNAVLEAREAQAALGWRAVIKRADREGGSVRIVVAYARSNGRPIDGLSLSGALRRPASSEGERTVGFTPLGGGRYEARTVAAAGAWDLTVAATSDEGDRFEFSNRMILE